jgi:hypothetical protein
MFKYATLTAAGGMPLDLKTTKSSCSRQDHVVYGVSEPENIDAA